MEKKKGELEVMDKQAKESNDGEGFDIDPILFALSPKRGLGKYQAIQMFLVMLSLPGIAFSVMSIVFIGYQPSYKCAPVNSTEIQSLLGLPGDAFNSSHGVDLVYEQCSIRATVNGSGENDQRVIELPCLAGYEYESRKDISFFTEWDLNCDKSGLTELTQTILMVGQGVGAFFLTSLADRFGRKTVHVISSIFVLVAAVGTALSPTYWVLVVCRFFTGAFQQGSGLVGFTMFLEISPKHFRAIAGVIDSVNWASCVMLLPLLAFIVQDYSWRHLQFFIAAFSAYTLLLPFFLDESLRWLVTNKKVKEAERVIKKASRINGSDYNKAHEALMAVLNHQQPHDDINNNNAESLGIPEITSTHGEVSIQSISQENGSHSHPMNEEDKSPVLNQPINSSKEENGVNFNFPVSDEESAPLTNEKRGLDEHISSGPIPASVTTNGPMERKEEAVKRYTVVDLLKHPLLRKTAFIICYLWVTNSVTYYGLMLLSATLAGNRFFNFFLQGMVELPAFLCVFFAFKRFGRRNVTRAFQTLTACALLVASLLLATVTNPVVGLVTNVLSLIGKFGISASFCALFLTSPELFPTNVRTAGLGMSSAVARVGGMVAPYSKNLADLVFWAPGVIFSGMSLLAAYVVMMLPETKGRPLPTTIEQLESWCKTKKNKSDKVQKAKKKEKQNVIYKPCKESGESIA